MVTVFVLLVVVGFGILEVKVYLNGVDVLGIFFLRILIGKVRNLVVFKFVSLFDC